MYPRERHQHFFEEGTVAQFILYVFLVSLGLYVVYTEKALTSQNTELNKHNIFLSCSLILFILLLSNKDKKRHALSKEKKAWFKNNNTQKMWQEITFSKNHGLRLYKELIEKNRKGALNRLLTKGEILELEFSYREKHARYKIHSYLIIQVISLMTPSFFRALYSSSDLSDRLYTSDSYQMEDSISLIELLLAVQLNSLIISLFFYCANFFHFRTERSRAFFCSIAFFNLIHNMKRDGFSKTTPCSFFQASIQLSCFLLVLSKRSKMKRVFIGFKIDDAFKKIVAKQTLYILMSEKKEIPSGLFRQCIAPYLFRAPTQQIDSVSALSPY